jgi:cytoskeletal protein RodZ
MKQKHYNIFNIFNKVKSIANKNSVQLLLLLLLVLIAILLYSNKNKIYETMTINIYTDKEKYKLIETKDEEDSSDVVPYDKNDNTNAIDATTSQTMSSQVTSSSDTSSSAATSQVTSSEVTNSEVTSSEVTNSEVTSSETNAVNETDNAINNRTASFSDRFIAPLKPDINENL